MILTSNQKHTLRLTAVGMADGDGWAKVSDMVWPIIDAMPADLIEREKLPEGGRARLTARGQAVFDYSF